jgi:hypothetical protein
MRNSIVGISGVKPPQALAILGFCAAHGGARECPATLPRYLSPNVEMSGGNAVGASADLMQPDR